MTNIVRCAIYTRKSSEEGLDQDFNSLQAQRESCEAFIKSQKHEGWQLIKTQYDDGGFSGGSMNRPALQQLMRDIEAGKIDVVVVYKVDRLSRSLHDFSRMVEIFDRHKVSFVSVTQQFNTTSSMGRLTLNVLLSFAQFEREVTGERIRDKIAASKKKGMWMGGVVPLGYDAKDRKLIINPAEAETVRFIFRRYIELGSVRELWGDLKDKKIVTKVIATRPNSGGVSFSRGGLYHLLNNPTFVGKVRFRNIVYDGQHEAIISDEIWDAVQNMLAGNSKGVIQSYHKDDSALLKGKLYDALTGEPLAVTYSKKNGRRYRYYLTRNLKTDIRENASLGWRLPGPVIEKTVDALVRKVLADRDGILGALINADIPAALINDVLGKAREVADQSDTTLRDYVQKAKIGPEHIEVKVCLGKLFPMNHEHREICITHREVMRMQRRNNEMRIVLHESETNASVDKVLVKGIAQAHVWAEELFSGKANSLKEISGRYDLNEGYVKKLMPLAFLSPEIVLAIQAGQQCEKMTKEKLIRKGGFSLCWVDQKEIFQEVAMALGRNKS